MSDPRQPPPRIGAGVNRETTEPAGLQFEQFEPAPPSDASPESSPDPASEEAPTGTAACAACQQPITDTYFEAGGQVFCPRCRENYQAEQTGGSRIGRLLRAIVFGTLAGIGGTIIWFGVRKLTGYEVGLIAVVVGLMVGGAVRAGSRGRGGAFYQLLAVFITYSSIAANYVPDVFQALFEDYEKDRPAVVATTLPASQPSTQLEDAATASRSDTSVASPDEGEPAGAVGAIIALILISLIAFAIAFVSPVLAGFENIIGLLIIGFALWEAWKINKRTVVNFTGPYALAGGNVPPPPPLPGAGTV
ncbi:MAG: LIM domain-containing protein [Planctomycetota bacterium]|nr:LIM domain-containing protein [Planctomycetota bacterium]